MPDNATNGTALARRETSDVGQFQRQLESRAADIQMALPAHIKPDKFQRTILTAVAQNPDLLKADRQSLILACYKAAQDALLPDGREAALVTFNTRYKDPEDGQWKSKKLVQYMPMVYGLRKKVLQSGEVVGLEVNIVYRAEVEKGTFLYEVGLEPPIRHRPSLDLTLEETGDDQIVAAYSIATMKDGTKSYELMRRFEIDKVRQCSQTGATGKTDRSGKPIEPKGPWVEWFPEQAKKTVARRHTKVLPMSGDVIIDVEGRELENSMATARALGSVAPDAPAAIEDRTDDTPHHDPETGEILEETLEAASAKLPEEAAAEAQPRQQRSRPKPTDAERQPDTANVATEQTATSTDDRDELGVTRDPNETVADRLLAEFANAASEGDLKKLWDSSELDRAPMSDDLHEAVTNGYHRHEKRLRTPETAGAK